MAIFIAPTGSASAPALAHPVPSAAAASPDLPAPPAAAQPVSTHTSRATTKESAELKVYWGRLVFASVILLVILVFGFTAAVLQLNDWSTPLIHSFELLLGIFIGLLGGDIAAKQTS